MKNILLLIFTLTLTNIHAQELPLDDITGRKVIQQKLPLVYPPLAERDLMWETRIWRVIDVREKMNLPFVQPERPFFEIVTEAAESGEMQLYSAETDDFSMPLSNEELQNILFTTDTVEVYTEAENFELKVIQNQLFYEDVKRFRVKEVWFFDSQASVMRVRILGIAPLIEVNDDFGNFKYEKPLFWVHYPSSREVFAHEKAFVEGNRAARTTWEDVMEKRQFASVIYKESDVLNRRLEDMYSGVDALLEADNIKQKIFNIEQDFWSR